jgi:hypothetical protein
MSQRGVDQDQCPQPKDGGCVGPPANADGVFYNNNIGACTSEQVMRSDALDYVSGTFVWSGFDYLGEARGWPQNVKCRGTVSDIAGFTKETAYWLRSWWLSNISTSDAGRPVLGAGMHMNAASAGMHIAAAVSTPTPITAATATATATATVSAVSTAAAALTATNGDEGTWTVHIIDTWAPVKGSSTRSIHVYSNAPSVRLEVNGKAVAGGAIVIPFFGMATFDSVTYAAGNLTAVALDSTGTAVASHTLVTAGAVAGVVLSIDVPSKATGTGSAVVLDGEDVAMLRATLVDAHGVVVPFSSNNVTFSVVSGPGRVWATHNGDPANISPSLGAWTPAYHGFARAVIRTTIDAATAPAHRRRMTQIDQDRSDERNVFVVDPDAASPSTPYAVPIVVEAVVDGLAASRVSIPVTLDLGQLPAAVASQLGMAR